MGKLLGFSITYDLYATLKQTLADVEKSAGEPATLRALCTALIRIGLTKCQGAELVAAVKAERVLLGRPAIAPPDLPPSSEQESTRDKLLREWAPPKEAKRKR